VVDVPLPQVAVVHGLDAVPLRVEQEAAVVDGAVHRSRPGLAVGRVPGVDAGAPEGVDVLPRRRRERDVEPGRGGLSRRGFGEREVVPFGEVVAAGGRLDLELAEHASVEPLRGLAVVHADRHVVEHRPG
jgi:hypothetical protein